MIRKQDTAIKEYWFTAGYMAYTVYERSSLKKPTFSTDYIFEGAWRQVSDQERVGTTEKIAKSNFMRGVQATMLGK